MLKNQGTTFSQLLKEARVTTASQLIKETTSSLTEIAYYCGFADQAHFTRTFTAYAGAPPSAYATLVREKNE
jgi:AraC family transcriptional regulator